MATVNFTQTLQNQYSDLYSGMEIRLDKLSTVENSINKILDNKPRYEQVVGSTQIPWYFVGIVHCLEASLNFSRHLHNGDPLTDRTRQVPKGRPKTGNPPFAWEESALDSLLYHELDKVNDWSLPRLLYELERYNGWGYRLYHPHVLSPYLWSFSNHYISGKYIADGTWSETAVSNQIGAVVLLRRLEQRNEIPSFSTLSAPNKPFFSYSTQKKDRAEDLQRFLNTFNGIALLVDGVPGKKTSDAVKKIFGHYLPNTPE